MEKVSFIHTVHGNPLITHIARETNACETTMSVAQPAVGFTRVSGPRQGREILRRTVSIRYYTYYIILGIIPSSIIQHDPHDPHDAASMTGAVPPQAAQPTPSRVARTGIRDTLVRTAQRARRPASHRLPPVSRLLRRPPAHTYSCSHLSQALT